MHRFLKPVFWFNRWRNPDGIVDIDRRRSIFLLAGGGAAGVSALTLAGCNQSQVAIIEADVAAAIQDVQAYVAAACHDVGKLVPTAQSVFNVLASLAGTNDVIAGVAATGGLVLSAAQAIANTACAVIQPPSPTPLPQLSFRNDMAGATPHTPSSGIQVTPKPGKAPVPVVFY